WRDLQVFVSGAHPTFVTAPPQRPMTIRDLLSHTSGLTYGNVERTPVDAAYRKLGVADRSRPGNTLQKMIDSLAEVPLEFSPGTRWNYSVSTDVLGYLVEILSGQRFAAYLREHLFGPLEMNDTGFTIAPEKLPRFACNYQLQPDGSLQLIDAPERSTYRECTFFSGGGGLVSTIEDYFRFTSMLLNGGVSNGIRLL